MAQEAAVAEALRRHGLEPMAPGAALDALRGSLQREERLAVVADIRWESYAPVFTLARRRPLIEDITQAREALGDRAADRAHDGTAGRELRERLSRASEQDRRPLLLKLVRTEIARVLGHATPETVDPKRAFKELGFDSLTAVELRNRLEAVTELELPATLVFDYPTPIVLSDYLLAELGVGGVSRGAALDADLAGLERALVSLEDGPERSDAATRLRALLNRIEGRDRERSVNGGSEPVAVLERVQAASDEEIFDFIDRELGAS
jgi:acyl carrier protein